jgi:hypothetical protein
MHAGIASNTEIGHERETQTRVGDSEPKRYHCTKNYS